MLSVEEVSDPCGMWSVIFIGNHPVFIKQSIGHETDEQGCSGTLCVAAIIYIYIYTHTVYYFANVKCNSLEKTLLERANHGWTISRQTFHEITTLITDTSTEFKSEYCSSEHFKNLCHLFSEVTWNGTALQFQIPWQMSDEKQSSSLNTVLWSTSEFMFKQRHLIIHDMVRHSNKSNVLKSVHLKSRPSSSGFDASFMNEKTWGTLHFSRIF